jgi:PKD repeat protein
MYIKIRKSALFVFLSAIISGLVLVSPVCFSLAQESASVKISGYILDSDGDGIAGAVINLNAPENISSVYSDSSGYYVLYAPTGAYQINVWPPFDSNYLSFSQPAFSVETSDISKNITLSSGYKLSGYLTDSFGEPVRGAIVSLDEFHCGWYSNNEGYYFVTAPAGLYQLLIQPKTGPTFLIYNENNFSLSGDASKNFSLTSANITFTDNFDDGFADGWIQHDGSWSFTNGEYCVSVGADGISTVNWLSFIDCTIETKLRFTDSVGFRSGIIFRFVDTTHYYSIELSNEYDRLDMIKYTPEDPSYGETFAQLNETNFQRGTEYQLKVIVNGNLFRCFIDGEEVLNGTDDSYTSGGVGLRARRADVCFDNFRIENATIAEVKTPELVNPELLAWWKLNEGAGTVVTDSSGNYYQGTLHGASWMNYQGNMSLNFDGKSDYVSLPSLELTDLDSLTVVAWIDSDLTEVGFIVYHGDGGEFKMGNGDLGDDVQNLNINSTRASFSVKLSDYRWYEVQSSSPMKPDVWHQIVGIWEKGVSLRVYVDGVLAGENTDIPAGSLYNPGSSFPSSLGIYSQDRFSQQDFFKGRISNVMVFNKALTLQEINALYEDTEIPTVARPTLDVSCKSLTPYSSLTVEIQGSLTLYETAVPDAQILLSYSANGGKTWQDLTMVNTASDGTYSATWNPSITGSYQIKAVYEGDATYLGTTAAVNFSVTLLQDDAPPVTNDNYDGSWHNSDFTISLSARDTESSVAETYYRINDGQTRTLSTSGPPIINTEDENNKLEYWSIDTAENQETPKLVTGIKLDKTAPFGSIIINENAGYTNLTSVTLSLSADDTISGVAQMRFSNDETEWSSWEAYSASKTWTLTSGDETKTVYVQFKDNAGLISGSYYDSIILDATKPTADAGQNQIVEVDTPVTFNASASSNNMDIVSYEWEFGDGATSTGEIATHTYDTASTYIVTLTIKDATGNADTHQITVTVKKPEEFPLWTIGVAAAVAIAVVAATVFLWKRRK